MTGTEVTRRPSRRSAVLALGAGAVVPIAGVSGGGSAGAISAVGIAALAAGVVTARQRVVDGGALVGFLGVVLAASQGATTVAVLLGTAATVVAWDVGGNAISLARQLGRGADTLRVEVLHALLGAGVGLLATVVGLVLFRAGPTGQPVTTLFVLLVAATLLLVSLNRS